MFQPTLPMTCYALNAAYQAGLAAIAGGQTEIDLSTVPMVDSSAVAAMLAWRREAARRGANLVFLNTPATLLSLAQLYGVSDLLYPDVSRHH